MNIILALYLAEVCQGLTALCLCIGIALFIVDFFLVFGMFDSAEYGNTDHYIKLKKGLVCSIIVSLVMLFTVVFIPSKTTLLAYTGISISKELNTEIQSSETYQKVVKILNKELDGYIAKQEKRKKYQKKE